MKSSKLRSIPSLLALLVVAFVFLSTVAVMHAEDVPPSPAKITASTAGGFDANAIVQWLTPIIVPLVITGIKRVLPRVPSWALPLLAPVLGVLVDVINSMATSHQTNMVVAALLGLAGVGVREVKNQVLPPKEPAS